MDQIIRAPRGESLSEDQLRHYVPALFAEEPHESRSDRYRFIPTIDVVKALVAADFRPVEARQSLSRDVGKRPYTKHMIRFRAGTPLAVGDSIYEVIMRNGHDGSACYEMTAGLLKLLCLNGMAVKSASLADVKVRHSGNQDLVIREVVDGARAVLDYGPKVLETVKQWQTIELTPDEQGIYSVEAHKLRFADHEGKLHTPIEPKQLLQARRSADAGSDLYSVFNRVQENSIRGGLSALGRDKHGFARRSTTKGIKGIDGDLKLNRALWSLTEKMAELKQAA